MFHYTVQIDIKSVLQIEGPEVLFFHFTSFKCFFSFINCCQIVVLSVLAQIRLFCQIQQKLNALRHESPRYQSCFMTAPELNQLSHRKLLDADVNFE